MRLSALLECTHAELMQLAHEFRREYNSPKGKEEWGMPLDDVSVEPGGCSMVSNTVIDWLAKRGIKSTFITGEGSIPKGWKDVPKEPGEGDGHTAVRVGSYVLDFTIRQFDRKLPYPRLITVGEFDEEWKKVD